MRMCSEHNDKKEKEDRAENFTIESETSTTNKEMNNTTKVR